MPEVPSLQLDQRRLILRSGQRTVSIELSTVLRARLYDRILTKPYMSTSPWQVGALLPHAGALRVQLVNKEEGLFIPVTFRPEPDGFRLIVHAEGIVEQFGLNRKLMELDVLPEFLTSRVGEAGWFLLPCYAGALVNFKEKSPAVNRDRIYMDQPVWTKFNIFNAYGMSRGDEGVLAIVHRGDFFCHVATEVNQGGVNRIYASLGLRHHPGEMIKGQAKEIIFRFLQGKDAGYAGMGKAFRQYLIHERGVSPLKERLAENPVLRYSVGAMRTKIFMALKQQPFALDGRAPVVSYTTCEEAERILDAMQAAGLRKAVITLVGWNLGGHDGAYPTRFPVEPCIGGEEGLRRLIGKALAMGYQVVPHDNWSDVYRASPDFDNDVVARDEHGMPRVGALWGGGLSLNPCPVAFMERYGPDFDRVAKLGFQGHYYLDAQSSVLWTCHHPRHPADEEQFMTAKAAQLQIPRALYGAVSCEVGPVHHLPYVDEIASMPASEEAAQWLIERSPTEFRSIIERIVPFYAIAVHGLVTYQMGWVHGYRNKPGGAWRGMLQTIGLGGRPSMEVECRPGGFGDVYADSIRDIKEPYRIAFEELADIHAEPMEEFEELSRQCTRITYGNGAVVTVNWGDAPVEEMQPMTWKMVRR